MLTGPLGDSAACSDNCWVVEYSDNNGKNKKLGDLNYVVEVELTGLAKIQGLCKRETPRFLA